MWEKCGGNLWQNWATAEEEMGSHHILYIQQTSVLLVWRKHIPDTVFLVMHWANIWYLNSTGEKSKHWCLVRAQQSNVMPPHPTGRKYLPKHGRQDKKRQYGDKKICLQGKGKTTAEQRSKTRNRRYSSTCKTGHGHLPLCSSVSSSWKCF